jgi:spore coat polysaccharide biosynthesis protein SpsF (cytidylyltransferase family)
MDKSQKVFDENLKNEVKAALLQAIISGLEKKSLSLIQMKASANYILDHIEDIKNYSQFMVFMDELNNKWSIFKDVYRIYSNRFYQEKEKEVINRLSGFIRSQN